MAKYISEVNVHRPIPILQKLFTSRPPRHLSREATQEEAHHLKSQPVPEKLFTPRPTQTPGLQRDRAGASIGSKHPIPTARQRDSPTSRTIPASAGPVPRSHLQDEAHHLKSQPVPQKLFTPRPTKTTKLQRDRAGASIGSKHPIPTARQRESPTSRTIPASAGPIPQSPPRNTKPC